jgi:hypothetical protein
VGAHGEPCAPNIDFVLLYSVFIQMPPADIEHHVQEISRMLASDGVCMAGCILDFGSPGEALPDQ